MTTENKFKLTFNKPTVDAFMKGDDFDGLQVRMEDGNVEFLPVAVGKPTTSPDYPGDVIPISTRERGGAEMIVEGSEASYLLNLLTDLNPQGRFFVVERGPGGWLQLSPFDESDDRPSPPKFTPHMRVWANLGSIQHRVQGMGDCPAIEKSLEDMTIGDVRQLHERISAYEAERRPGRPPREILEIKSRIAEFAEAISPMMPVMETDTALLEQVHAMIGRVLGKDEAVAPQTAPKAHKEKPKEVRASAPPKAPEPSKQAEKRPNIADEARSWKSTSGASDESVRRAAESLGLGKTEAEATPPIERMSRGVATQRLSGGKSRTVQVHRLGGRRRVGQHAPA